MTGKHLEIISQIVLWYENSFRIDCIYMYLYELCQLCLLLNKTTCINIIDYYICIS